MKVLLDACVLFPSIVREILMDVASQDVFTPLWSQRILDEWCHSVAKKLGAVAGIQAKSESVLMQTQWPTALVQENRILEEQLWLPDPADKHVLAAAVSGGVDIILTFNIRDFPQKLLAEQGVSRTDPDAFLTGVYQANPDLLDHVTNRVYEKANMIEPTNLSKMQLLKKAHLPRLAKVLSK